MNPIIIAAIVVVALIVVGIAITTMRRRQRERLQKRFGPYPWTSLAVASSQPPSLV